MKVDLLEVIIDGLLSLIFFWYANRKKNAKQKNDVTVDLIEEMRAIEKSVKLLSKKNNNRDDVMEKELEDLKMKLKVVEYSVCEKRAGLLRDKIMSTSEEEEESR